MGAPRVIWVALLTAACSLPDGEYFGKVGDPDPKHFTWCNSGEPEYLDPALSTSTTDIPIVYELFDGLTTYDPLGLPRPSLAKSWESSDDLRTFTFHLRDDARWSNDRPLTSADFGYSLARVLHPLTASKRGESLWKLRNGKLYTSGLVKLVLHDSGPFKAGDVVAIDKEKLGAKDDIPDSNLRRAAGAVTLRAEPNPSAAVFATVPAGEDLTVIELGGPACGAPYTGPARDVTRCDWAYVFFGLDDGVFGWVPVAELVQQPNAELDFPVAVVGDATRAGTMKGKDLLMLPEVLGVRAPDPHTVILETEGPTPYLIDLTLQGGYRPVPRETVSRWPRRWTMPANIVTSGPFHLTFWRQRDKFELAKSKTFWGRDLVKLDRVTFLSMNEQSANANTYYQGSCDAAVSNNVPNSYLPVLAGEVPGSTAKKDYIRAPYLGIYLYLVNVKRFPNVHFRRALSHALDRSQMPVMLKGGQIGTESYTPGTPINKLTDEELALCGVTRETPGVALIVETGKLCYVPPVGARYDLAKAKEELEIARKELGGKLPKVTVRFNTGVEQHKTIAEFIQHEWQTKLHLDVELESQEWKTFLKATVNGEYDVARMGWIGNFPDPEAEFLGGFKCESPDNRTGFCSEEYDRLFAEAEQTFDRKKRLEIIRRAEELMINEAPILPLYVYTQHVLQKPYMRDLYINLTNHQSLRETWIDPDWKKARTP
jgi:oligopeptide transport system substrate-binding protein